MVLCSVGLLFSLLYSSVLVSTQEFISVFDDSADVPDPDLEWLHLEHVLADEAKVAMRAFPPKRRPVSSPRSPMPAGYLKQSKSSQSQQSQQILGMSSQSQQSPQILGMSSQTQQSPQIFEMSSQTQQSPQILGMSSQTWQSPQILGMSSQTQQSPQILGMSSQTQQSPQILGMSSQTQQSPQILGMSSQTQQSPQILGMSSQTQQSPQSTTLPTTAQVLPEFVRVSGYHYHDFKRLFRPENGARVLPARIKQMLSVTAPPTPAPTTRPQQFEVLCHIDRMYVRVRRELFSTFDAYKNLKLGSCPVNQASKDHFYLLYLLQSDCGFHNESTENEFLVSNLIHYRPNTINGIVREPSFDVSIRCRYHRFHHSFRAGYRPTLPVLQVYRRLNSKQTAGVSLSVMDESGNDINIFTMGTPMCFEAVLSSPKLGDRLYINECFVTDGPDPRSTPQYTVIANQGCMTDGMLTTQSKFKLLENTPRTVQKFCIGAFRFKETLSNPSKLMYLHCDISVGKLEATPSSRTCNFDLRTGRWKELYAKHSACASCPDSYSPLQPRDSFTETPMVSSPAWEVTDGGSKMTPRSKSIGPEMVEGEPENYADFLNHWENE